MINIKENDDLSRLNHSCAHLLAQAVKHLYPNAKFWVGPVVEEGFYYDIDLGDKTLTMEDIPAIEKEMKKVAKDGKRIVRHEISKEEALDLFKDDPYKIDLISRMDEDNTVISMYTQGDFTDLCRGPHVETVKELKHFKLLKVSGAYWKGDSNNKMLQRIYGVCFPTEEELDAYLQELADAQERDHRKIGKDLELFMSDDLVGRGLPMFLPNGYIVWQELENYIRKNINRITVGILICLYTGIRIGELCALKEGDIDLKNKKITIKKTLIRIKNLDNHSDNKTNVIIDNPKSSCSVREIPIPKFIVPILKDVCLKKDFDTFLLTGTKRYVETRTYFNKYKKILNDLQLPNYNFHALRHTFATRCIENGCDPKTLSEILGHSSVKITLERYVHPSYDNKIKMMNKLKFICN